VQPTEIIILTGKPYAGKSKLSKTIISENYLSPVIPRLLPMGERLRSIAAGDIKSKYNEILSNNIAELKGHVAVPKDIPLGIFEEFVNEKPNTLIILDGFPRYVESVEGFVESIAKLNAKVLAVCHVDVDDELVFSRNKKRKQRYSDVKEDDNFVQKRLQDYYENMLPTINALSKSYDLFVINGGSPLNFKLKEVKRIYHTESAKLNKKNT
jgi:adenylate kinase family enzyme